METLIISGIVVVAVLALAAAVVAWASKHQDASKVVAADAGKVAGKVELDAQNVVKKL